MKSFYTIALVITGIIAGAQNAKALSLTQNDSYFVGYWVGQDPANIPTVAQNVTTLIGMDLGDTAPDSPQKNDTIFTRSENDFGGLANPYTTGTEFDLSGPFDASGFLYLTAKYGNATAVWYLGEIGSAIDSLQVPSKFSYTELVTKETGGKKKTSVQVVETKNPGLSNIKALNGPVNVPDGGTSAMLLGAGLSALAILRRKLA